MFPKSLNLPKVSEGSNLRNLPEKIILNSGLTFLVGPNGSGKTQILRSIKQAIENQLPPQIPPAKGRTRFLSAGRLAYIETYRSNWDGRRAVVNYEDAYWGDAAISHVRLQSESAIGDFHTLDNRPDLRIKVSERLRRLFKRDIIIEWRQSRLKISFQKTDPIGDPYTSSLEASGLLHLVSLLTAIYNDEIKALLIDEPEVSLHPQLQAFLLREIQSVAGDPSEEGKKLIVIATHSTSMIVLKQPEDLCNFIFCKELGELPKQIPTTAGELKNSALRNLIQRLGQEHKLAIFAQTPVLVEGHSDMIICNGLNQKLGLYIEAAGTQIVPVEGKGQISSVVKLMELMGKESVVISDADSFIDDQELINIFAAKKSINDYAADLGHPDIVTFAKRVRSDFCKIVDKNWVDIEEFASKHIYWTLSKKEDKNKRRAALSTLMQMEENDIDTINNSAEWNSLKKRIAKLFECLEIGGCFILQRGPIESYYSSVEVDSLNDKVGLAIDEVIGISEEDQVIIKKQYGDIVQALRFASNIPEIDESNALIDFVLSAITPALRTLTVETKSEEVKASAEKQIGENASLFTYDVDVNSSGTPCIKIDIASPILDRTGFPLEFTKNRNPLDVVEGL